MPRINRTVQAVPKCAASQRLSAIATPSTGRHGSDTFSAYAFPDRLDGPAGIHAHSRRHHQHSGREEGRGQRIRSVPAETWSPESKTEDRTTNGDGADEGRRGEGCEHRRLPFGRDRMQAQNNERTRHLEETSPAVQFQGSIVQETGNQGTGEGESPAVPGGQQIFESASAQAVRVLTECHPKTSHAPVMISG